MMTTKFFFGWIFDQFDIRDWIAVNEQQVGQRAFFDNADFASIPELALPPEAGGSLRSTDGRWYF